MCCVGFFLRSLGCSIDSIRNRDQTENLVKVPEKAKWMVNQNIRSLATSLAAKIYNTNDNRDVIVSDQEREEKLQNLFAKAGIKVTFK